MKKTLITSLALATSLLALDADKVSLKKNMNLNYKVLPKAVDNFSDIFSEGMVYGRLRTNSFYWDWDDEAAGKDNKAMGVGGSLIYKTAKWKGLSSTVGMYTAQNPDFFRMDEADVGSLKAGKDTLSRNKVKNGGSYDGNFGMSVIGQAYIQYDMAKTKLRAGRQMFHSVFTKSNDTKMIPNTFDGVTAESKDLVDTTIQLAYLMKQKLRDHEDHHDVIAFDSWNQNDDSAVNKSLTKDLVGIDNRLVIATATNKSIKNFKLQLSNANIPNVMNNLTVEGHYTIPVGKKSKLVPGFRYMIQTDLLGSDKNVSNLKNNHSGYSEPTSLDSGLLAARIDYKRGALLVRYGYSKIEDKADILAMWRGFATGGFTRAMAQYNWYANTVTNMIRVDYNFGKDGMIPGFKFLVRYAMQDFDETKAGVQADSNVVHIDLMQDLSKNTELKVRLAFVDANPTETQTDVSYNEYRLELNYFF